MTARPVRIQRKRTAGWRMPPNTVYVGRPTGWGNPFPVHSGTSTECGVTKPIWTVGSWTGPAMWIRDSADEAQALSVEAYRAWIGLPAQQSVRDRAVLELRGKNLACWCRLDQLCHADVLLELANGPVCEAVEARADV